jgi:uncharacterized protein YggE
MNRSATLIPLTAALALAGCDLGQGSNGDAPIWAREATVEALGRAYIELPPDRASFTVVYEEQDTNSEQASAIAVRRANLATEAIRTIAGDSVRITSNMSIEPYYEQVTETIVRGEESREVLRENEHPDALLGYVSSVELRVEVLELEHLPTIRGAALAAGPRDSRNVQVYLDQTSEVQRMAFRAAVEDATERAEIVARISGDRIGRVLVLREGSDPCLGQAYGSPGRSEDNIVVTGSRIRRGSFDAMAPIATIDAEMFSQSGLVDPEMLIEIGAQYQLASDFAPQRVTASVCAIFAVE